MTPELEAIQWLNAEVYTKRGKASLALLVSAIEADAKTIAELKKEIAQMKDDAKHEAWEREEGDR